MKVGNQGFSGRMLVLALNGLYSTPSSPIDNSNDGNSTYASSQDSVTSYYDFSKFKGQHETKAPDTVEKEMFDKDGLDFLAVAFTAFKIAYLQGISVSLFSD